MKGQASDRIYVFTRKFLRKIHNESIKQLGVVADLANNEIMLINNFRICPPFIQLFSTVTMK